MKNIAIVVMASFLASCASTEELRIKQAEIDRTIPTCMTERECGLKWAAARAWLLNHSQLKIQILTNDFIETYNPTQYSPNLATRIVKEPVKAGGYRILISTWCNNLYGCNPNAFDAAIDFNKQVNATTEQ